MNSAAVNPTKQPLTTTRLRQIITNNDDEDDNEDDLRGYAQYASGPAPVSNSHLDHEIREDLAQADLGVQEALLIEDLLSVILVGTLACVLQANTADRCYRVVTQGIEGQFITFATDYAPEDAFERLRGPRFAIDESIGEDSWGRATCVTPARQRTHSPSKHAHRSFPLRPGCEDPSHGHLLRCHRYIRRNLQLPGVRPDQSCAM